MFPWWNSRFTLSYNNILNWLFWATPTQRWHHRPKLNWIALSHRAAASASSAGQHSVAMEPWRVCCLGCWLCVRSILSQRPPGEVGGEGWPGWGGSWQEASCAKKKKKSGQKPTLIYFLRCIVCNSKIKGLNRSDASVWGGANREERMRRRKMRMMRKMRRTMPCCG